jgi:hypothetical protein
MTPRAERLKKQLIVYQAVRTNYQDCPAEYEPQSMCLLKDVLAALQAERVAAYEECAKFVEEKFPSSAIRHGIAKAIRTAGREGET